MNLFRRPGLHLHQRLTVMGSLESDAEGAQAELLFLARSMSPAPCRGADWQSALTGRTEAPR